MSETIILTPPQRMIMHRLTAEFAGVWSIVAPAKPPNRLTLDRLAELGLVDLQTNDKNAVIGIVATDKAKTFQVDPDIGRPSTLKGAFADLAQAMGGSRKLVEKLGTTTRSLQRWNNCLVVPSKPVQTILRNLADDHGIAKTFPWET